MSSTDYSGSPAPKHPPVDELRAQLTRLIEHADRATLKRFHSKITKKKQLHRSCAVQSAPKSNWKPRSTEEALRIVELLERRVGLHMAPFAVGENEHCAKIMMSDICQVILRESTDVVDKSAKWKLAQAATSLSCRVCEEAQCLAADEGGAGSIEMQGSRQSPSWAPSTCRGSGIVLSKSGWPLFDTALARVRERITEA